MSSVQISWDNRWALAPDQEQCCSICFAKKCFHFLYVPFPLKSLGLILSIFLKVPSFLSWGTVAVALFYNLLIPMYSSWKLQWSSITHVCINYWNPFSPCKNGLKSTAGQVCWKYIDCSNTRRWPMNMVVGGERRNKASQMWIVSVVINMFKQTHFVTFFSFGQYILEFELREGSLSKLFLLNIYILLQVIIPYMEVLFKALTISCVKDTQWMWISTRMRSHFPSGVICSTWFTCLAILTLHFEGCLCCT